MLEIREITRLKPCYLMVSLPPRSSSSNSLLFSAPSARSGEAARRMRLAAAAQGHSPHTGRTMRIHRFAITMILASALLPVVGCGGGAADGAAAAGAGGSGKPK